MQHQDPKATAIRRTELSRPFKRAVEEGLLELGTSVFDYGCGHGDDIQRLRSRGLEATGWDPGHRPDADLIEADVVNLGFVLNVVPAPAERTEVLQRAWRLARQVLVVAARLTHDQKNTRGDDYRDGLLTVRGTFQKFFDQSELRELLRSALGEEPCAAEPGVFFVFRDEGLRQAFLAKRQRRSAAAPRVRISDQLYEAHEDAFEALSAFFRDRGRLPRGDELVRFEEIIEACGSIGLAFAVLRRVTSSEDWDLLEQQRRDDLLVYLALSALGGKAKFGQLRPEMQHDVRALCGNHAKACTAADQLLFSAGDVDTIIELTKESPVGKRTPDSFYAHSTVWPSLHPTLRVYEGCARHWVGHVEDANLIKLHRHRSQVSYLTYPKFDRDPHPSLQESLVVSLDTLQIQWRDYSERENPPILHRKEAFVSSDYEHYEKFRKLTAQEERRGLLEETATIGTKRGWEECLAAHGLALRGHRVVRRQPADEPPEA